MGWGRYLLLGSFGQQFDIEDQRREMQTIADRLRQKHQRDHAQDRQIQELIRENDALKLYVAGLVQLLIRKNLIQQNELEQLVTTVERTGLDLDEEA